MLDEIDYVVITAGSFDLLIEVVCEDDDHLLEILSRVRAVPERHRHRDLRLPQAPQANLLMGNPMTGRSLVPNGSGRADQLSWASSSP